MLNAAVAAFYYLRIIVYMFMRDPATEAPALRHGALLWGGLAAASALTILLGLFPSALLDVAGQCGRRDRPGGADLAFGAVPARSLPASSPQRG